MDKETLRKVQLVQLEIAKEIKRICDENNIEYWLDSGSALGAIRHKGFIPWDDDMDIGMKRDAYEQFLKIAPLKLKEDYYLQQWETDPGYAFAFAKVRKKNTVYIEDISKKSNAHNGIYVDIFPYDKFGNDIKKQGIILKFLKAIMQYKSGVRSWNEKGKVNIVRFMKNIPAIVLAPFCKRERLIKTYNSIATMYNDNPAEFYFPQGISKYGKWVIPVSALEEMIELPFEDTTFKVPKGYHDYLTHAYGDYMKLPPEDERENRHQIIEVRF